MNYFIYLWRCLRVTSREQLSFIGVSTFLVQNKFMWGKSLLSVNIPIWLPVNHTIQNFFLRREILFDWLGDG